MKKNLIKAACLLIFLLSIRFSNAQIIYTDVNPDVTTTGAYNLDLNNDNITDFVITHTSSAANSSRHCPGETGTNHHIKISPSNNNRAVLGYFENSNTNATKMIANSTIDAPALTWNKNKNQVMVSSVWKCNYACGYGGCGYYWGNFVEGQWNQFYPPVVDGFLGLKIISGGQSFYGWVRINIIDGSSFTVKDYAYNSTPGQAILAGQTTTDYIGILTVGGSPFCAGKNLAVPYIIMGTFSASNVVTTQLSDATGSFANPVTIGTLTSNISGNINAVIPATTPSGNGYRIRVVSSNPVRVSNPNENNLSVLGGPPNETITADGNTNICNGYVRLYAKYINDNAICNSFQWKRNGIDIPGATFFEYKPVSAGDYTCAITNGVGSITSNIITITANQVPVVVTAQDPTTVCGDVDVYLYTPDVFGCNFQWQLNGIDIPDATIHVYTARAAGDYRCVKTTACGSVTSNTIRISAYPPMAPVVINAAGGAIACNGPVILNANTEVGLTYQWYYTGLPNPWYYDFSAIPGATSSSYATTVNGSYYVAGKNSYGCIGYSNIISVLIGSPVADVIPLSGSICQGSSVTLYARPTHYDGSYFTSYSYQWQKNGVNINGATNVNYVAQQEGSYTVRVTVNAGGCSSTSPAAVITRDCSSAQSNSSPEDISPARTDHPAFEKEFSLLSIARNPVLSSATISFSLSKPEKVSLIVYDISGRLVKTIANKEMNEGTHQVTLDVKDLNAGIYLLRLQTSEFARSKKLVVIK